MVCNFSKERYSFIVPGYGRPLKRFIQTHIETLLAKKTIGGNVDLETTISVDFDGKELIIIQPSFCSERGL